MRCVGSHLRVPSECGVLESNKRSVASHLRVGSECGVLESNMKCRLKGGSSPQHGAVRRARQRKLRMC
jgi:hypothetical protein